SMQIWDTAGQERFQALGVAFWRGADACIIVYDVTNYASFRSVPNWLSEFIRQGDIGDPFNFPIAVIGNKTDLVGERIIYAPQMEELSRELKRICF
ncbi:P-loop containing nucleoside triphosphate hydrolase protein, partial [Zopfochytrium polystomum]